MKRGFDWYVKRYGGLEGELRFKYRESGKDLPWTKAYWNIGSRCSNPRSSKFSCYGGRGVKCMIRPSHLREAFFRDKAWSMRSPSVDRIDSRGHYTPENIRWIEFDDNRKNRLFSSPSILTIYSGIRRNFFDNCRDHRLTKYEMRKFAMRILGEIDAINKQGHA
jgi:hypothetical protein